MTLRVISLVLALAGKKKDGLGPNTRMKLGLVAWIRIFKVSILRIKNVNRSIVFFTAVRSLNIYTFIVCILHRQTLFIHWLYLSILRSSTGVFLLFIPETVCCCRLGSAILVYGTQYSILNSRREYGRESFQTDRKLLEHKQLK